MGDAVGDEAGGALEDLLAHLEVVLFQGAAGGDQVDDAVGEADQRRQLDRALDLDHFDLAAGPLEVALGDARVLGRDPHHPQAPLGLPQPLVALAPGEHHATAAEAEVEQLVDDAVGLLEQHVLAGDADVGGAGLDVGRHVGGPHRHQGDALGLGKISERDSPRTSLVSMPAASSASSVSPSRAPRGTATFSGPSALAAAHAGDLSAHEPYPRAAPPPSGRRGRAPGRGRIPPPAGRRRSA